MKSIFIVALFYAACCSSLRADEVDPSLKLHFDFDTNFSGGRVIDSSGNANDGLRFNLTNWITATNGVFGTTGGYFRKVGETTDDPPNVYPLTQYIAITNLNGIKFLTNATISMWARFDATNNGHNEVWLIGSGYPATFAWSPTEAANSWTIGKGTFENYLGFWVFLPDGEGRTVVRWPDDTVGGDNESTTRVHLYAITIDCPNNRAIAYYDGQPYMTNTIDVPWVRIYGTSSVYWVNWLCIGASTHDGTPWWGDDEYPNDGYFTGMLDDIRIYNRTLDDSEVRSLFQGYANKVWNQHLTAEITANKSVQLCWESVSNASYQVEYVNTLWAGNWIPLGSTIVGDGMRDCIADSTDNQDCRFYRIRPLPQP